MAAVGSAHAASGTLGELSVVVHGSSDAREVSDPLAVSDSLQVFNDTSQADASHMASMASASVGAHAAAVSSPADTLYSSAYAQVDRVYVVEELWFHVPAGYTGTMASFQAMTIGHLQAEGCRNNRSDPDINQCSNGYATVSLRAEGSRGSDVYSRRVDVSAGGVAAAPVNDLFRLEVPLPGATESCAVPTNWRIQVTEQVVVLGSALGTCGYPDGGARRHHATGTFSLARPACGDACREHAEGPPRAWRHGGCPLTHPRCSHRDCNFRPVHGLPLSSRSWRNATARGQWSPDHLRCA